MAEVFAIYDMMDEMFLTTDEVSSVMADTTDDLFEFDNNNMDSQLIY